MQAPTSAVEFRPDIEGLRGIAILLVLLFHAGLPWTPGGFIGVDVFFVISGFLITGKLWRESQQPGGLSIAKFYAWRIRRLLPAALVAVALISLVGLLIAAPLDRSEVAADGAASALSIANMRFIGSVDYFAPTSSPSPFLHFWSLSVEEQFYLVWPALIVLLTWRGGSARRLIAALLIGVFASFALSMWLTDASPARAFYLLPTRVWQLGVGGLLALIGVMGTSRRAGALAWAGLAAVVVAGVALTAEMPYPGLAALLPTAGAVALLYGGAAPSGPARLLAAAPLRFLGKISYSLYLWHWPLLVLPLIFLERALTGVEIVASVAAAIGVSWLSWRFVEQPFRYGDRSRRATSWSAIRIGVAGILSVALFTQGLAAALPSSAVAVQPTPGPSGSPAPSPSGSPVASDGPITLPADLTPSLTSARDDEERLRGDGCLAFERVTTPPNCVYGVKGSAITIALVGDSHASHWFPAIEAVALERGWRLLTFVKVSCSFTSLVQRNLALKREYRECTTFNEATVARLNQIKPALTIIVNRRTFRPIDGDITSVLAGAALGEMVARLPGATVILVDTPDPGRDAPACLSKHPSDIRACIFTQDDADNREIGVAERVAATVSGAQLIDLTSEICGAWPCSPIAGSVLIYRDEDHMTETFSRSLAAPLGVEITKLLPR
ncbi:MAG: acyltransferase family protein [Chloroflexi bacterium]|nr:acyltransferase family protein [Chloroflexota bacterium]